MRNSMDGCIAMNEVCVYQIVQSYIRNISRHIQSKFIICLYDFIGYMFASDRLLLRQIKLHEWVQKKRVGMPNPLLLEISQMNRRSGGRAPAFLDSLFICSKSNSWWANISTIGCLLEHKNGYLFIWLTIRVVDSKSYELGCIIPCLGYLFIYFSFIHFIY